MNNEEKQALRAALAEIPNASISVHYGTKQCYRYQNNPFESRGNAVRSPVMGRVRWHAAPGPVEMEAHLADVLVGGVATQVRARTAGDLSQPLVPDGDWVDHWAALAVIRNPE